MSRDLAGQFEVVLSNGLRIDRLPLGLAAGNVWLSFVFSGIDFFEGEHDHNGRWAWQRREYFRFEGPSGLARYLGGGSGGGNATQHMHFKFAAEDLPWLHVTYLEDGDAVAAETLDIA